MRHNLCFPLGPQPASLLWRVPPPHCPWNTWKVSLLDVLLPSPLLPQPVSGSFGGGGEEQDDFLNGEIQTLKTFPCFCPIVSIIVTEDSDKRCHLKGKNVWTFTQQQVIFHRSFAVLQQTTLQGLHDGVVLLNSGIVYLLKSGLKKGLLVL